MIRRASLTTLPRPDAGEFPWDRESTCLVADDGALSAALAKRLTARGWRVAQTAHAALDAAGPEALGLGRIGAYVTVAPRSKRAPVATADALLGGAREESWLLAQFRLARQLSAQLQAPGAPRRWFVAVTWLDGRLGLGAPAREASVLTAGVYGLVKTLRVEWPSVFCRAIDLDPTLDAAFAAERVVEELHDPNRTCAEVGHRLDGRATLAAREHDHG